MDASSARMTEFDQRFDTQGFYQLPTYDATVLRHLLPLNDRAAAIIDGDERVQLFESVFRDGG